MHSKVLKVLEFNKIIDLLKSCAITSLGKEKVLGIEPIYNINEIQRLQDETTEATEMIIKKGNIPLGGMKDIRNSLKRVSIGGSLNIEELVYIADFIYVCKKVLNYSKHENKNDNFPVLDPIFEIVEPSIKLEKEIRRCILDTFNIVDDATRELYDIRKNIKSANDRIKEQLNTIIHSSTYKTMLQDFVITIRNDRFCVPIKQEYKTSFPGMIHDQSSTGATVFMEPMSIIELNNKIKTLISREKVEIDKILRNLSEKVLEEKDTLQFNLDLLTNLDVIFARASLSLKMNGTRPIFNTKGYINIKKGRHPLLDKDKVVPTNIYLGKDFNMLLVTGPNTGGKTVSLKTIGLFTLMGQSGLHIPAFDNSELAVFDNIFADIGDEQSIEQSLSTFSSHMSNIVEILKNVTDNSLVLLDELGSGTDPTEGAGLAIAILNYLHQREIRTAVTTHYSELKVYAISTDGIENASCEFDIETLRPTYKLLIGVPGKSNAFAISKRLGLQEDIINDAKSVISKEDAKFEDIITDLEITKKSVELERERAQQYRQEAEKLKAEFELEKEKLEVQKKSIISKAQEESRNILLQAKIEADTLIKKVNKISKNLDTSVINDLRQDINQKIEDKSNILQKNNISNKKVLKTVNKGDEVFIHSFNQKGIVLDPPDSNGEVFVQAGIMKFKVSIKDLSLSNESQKKVSVNTISKRFTSSVKSEKSKYISPEIDLRGYMVLDAIEKIDKYLDDAYLAGLNQVTIIHGKGTGALRVGIHDHLRKHPHVQKYRLGAFGEGDAGVTIVEFK